MRSLSTDCEIEANRACPIKRGTIFLAIWSGSALPHVSQGDLCGREIDELIRTQSGIHYITLCESISKENGNRHLCGTI
jgi:hypothetical protein